MVCQVCGCNKAQFLANFGLEDTIDGWWDVVLPIGAMYRHLAADRRIPDYGLQGVLSVTICGMSGMRDPVVATTGKSGTIVARNLLQPILDVAPIQAKTIRMGRLNNDKANGKGKLRLECAAAVQFMRTKRLEALTMICLEEGGTTIKLVGGRLWGDVGRECWDKCAETCVYAWQMEWLSRGDVRRLHECSIRIGKAHLVLQWCKL